MSQYRLFRSRANLFFCLILPFCTGCTLNARIDSLGNVVSSSVESEPASPTPSLTYQSPQGIYGQNESITLSPSVVGKLKNFRTTPSLPAGITIDSESGIISGVTTIPTAKKLYVIQAIDNLGNEVSSQFEFEVAANFIVNSTLDEQDSNPGDGLCATNTSSICTLRAAVEEANAQSVEILSKITLPVGTYPLVSLSLNISSSRVKIVGSDRATTVIDANPDGSAVSPGINISAASTEVTIEGVSIKNASLVAPGGVTLGVGLKSLAANLTLKNCEISNHSISGTNASAVLGVGLYHKSTGSLTIDNCTIKDNSGNLTNALGYSYGAGAYLEASTINISNSTIRNNTFPSAQGASGAGGIYIKGNSSVYGSEISSNRSRNFGGAIFYDGTYEHEIHFSTLEQNTSNSLSFGNYIYLPGGSRLDISNSALLDSTATSEHVYVGTASTLTVKNSTLYATSASELIELSSSTANIEASTLYSEINAINFRLSSGTLLTKSSIYLGNNFTCTAHSTPIVSYGYNIFADSTCNSGNSNDLANTAPLLVAPANNGGTTKTMRKDFSSPAKNLVPASECLEKDQIERSRSSGSFCDSGAYQD